MVAAFNLLQRHTPTTATAPNTPPVTYRSATMSNRATRAQTHAKTPMNCVPPCALVTGAGVGINGMYKESRARDQIAALLEKNIG